MFQSLSELAKLIRYYILISTTAAGSGHPTSSLSATDLMTTLMFGGFFRFDLDRSQYPLNDRLIFSKGHASPLFYSLYAAAGKVAEKELLTLRKFSSRLEGHPTMQFPYTEAATGSLGQGLSVGLGMALAVKLQVTSYELNVSREPKVFVLLGDSEMAEGSNYEAMELAAHYKLNNLIAIVDVNRLGQRGETMYGWNTEVYKKKFEAFGWNTVVIDGHSIDQITEAFKKGEKFDRPLAIIAKTVKGKGVSFLENKEGWHGKALSKEQLEQALPELGTVNKSLRGEVLKPETIKIPSSKLLAHDDSKYSIAALAYTSDKKVATRKAYGNALARLGAQYSDIVALDAEVSNSTHAEEFKKVFPERFYEMFIAEQNMVGAALGLARLGKVPFVSTFAAFFTRAFDQIRMAQYSNGNIKFVGSHVGVSIGEDGSSQMGLEDLAMFRSILGSVVLYPSDAVATERLVELLALHRGISYLRTTRGEMSVLYSNKDRFKIGGSKVLKESSKDKVTIVAAGITVHEALQAAENLEKNKIAVRVIDAYSIKPLDVKTILKAHQETKALVVVEDHHREGGLYSAVCEALAGQKIAKPIYSLAVTKMPHSGKPEELMEYEGISAKGIVKMIKRIAE
jgi:transketolase